MGEKIHVDSDREIESTCGKADYSVVIEWQQVLHCCLFRAMSCKVLSHWWGESRGLQPGRWQAPATTTFFVIFFIFDCHVNCWRRWDFFQLDPWVTDITCNMRFSFIRGTWPSHRRWLLDDISQAFCFVSLSENPSTHLLVGHLLPTYVQWSLDIFDQKPAVDEGLLHVLAMFRGHIWVLDKSCSYTHGL